MVCPLVSWFISHQQMQSLYPGRPRGGLTVFPSRHLSPDADLRNPEGLLCTCAPPRARSSCPTVPLSELPEPHLRVVEDFVSLARPLATAFRPHPSSTSTMRHAAGCAKPHLVCAPTAHTPLVTSGIESRRRSPRTTPAFRQRQTRTSSHQGHDAAPPDSRIRVGQSSGPVAQPPRPVKSAA